eukprot:9496658-Pyramimonas_sp.AAC.1
MHPARRPAPQAGPRPLPKDWVRCVQQAQQDALGNIAGGGHWRCVGKNWGVRRAGQGADSRGHQAIVIPSQTIIRQRGR